MIQLTNNHITIIGITGSGKTYSFLKAITNVNKPLLYFNATNLKGKDLPVEFRNESIKFHNGTWKQLQELIKGNQIVNIITPDDLDKKEKFLCNLINFIFRQKESLYIAVDEVGIYTAQTQKKIKSIATSGRSSGKFGIFITQRLADINNTIFNMCKDIYIFRYSPLDNNYFKTYGLDYESLQDQFNKTSLKFPYIKYDISGIYSKMDQI